MADGHLNKCKEFSKSDNKSNREVKIDYYRNYDLTRAKLEKRVKAMLAYSKTEKGILAGNRAKNSWSLRNKAQAKVNKMTSNAIRDGILIKECCEVCGNEEAQAHHDDYNKPFEVRWLCTQHHSEWHKHNEPVRPF